jgi:DNA-binding helix-hairpin-helix protein with protein kinase domain
MTPRILYDNLKRRVELGPQLHVGGEGAVFQVVGRPNSLAKVYHQPPDNRKQQKLRIMLGLSRPDLLNKVAWPTATLHQTLQGSPVGFLMPRASGKEVHQLYSPAHRKKDFPAADWKFLIQSAAKCAIAFDAIHHAGHTIADVNERNVLVSPEGTVTLIDCDSYQISAEGQTFLCDVGMPLYTPPELQGQSFRGVVRTHNHDLFGLAVLIFHLLFVGRHPFSGRPLTRGELIIEQAIKEFRFAYSGAAAQFRIAPPPQAPLLDILPARIALLFERAFGIHSAQPGGRPTASEWSKELGFLNQQLQGCKDPGHKYSQHLSACCWCDLMKAGGPNYFISVAIYRLGTATTSLTFAVGAEWEEIDRVPGPNTVYHRPSPPASRSILPTPLPPGIPPSPPPAVTVPHGFLQKLVGWAAIVVLIFTILTPAPVQALMLVFGFTVGSAWLILEWVRQTAVESARAERDAIAAGWRREKEKREESYGCARRCLEKAEVGWQQTADAHEQSFGVQKASLEKLKADFLSLKSKHDQEHRELEKNKETAQLVQFLQKWFISDHDIPNIGSAREAILRSNGIETAHDIREQRIRAIPGFGRVYTGNLLAWRRQAEQRFRFNAAAPISPTEIAAIEVKYKQLQQCMGSRLRTGLVELRERSQKATHRLSELYAKMPELVAQVEQAKIDAELMSAGIA